jgi:hypothetical protein
VARLPYMVSMSDELRSFGLGGVYYQKGEVFKCHQVRVSSPRVRTKPNRRQQANKSSFPLTLFFNFHILFVV